MVKTTNCQLPQVGVAWELVGWQSGVDRDN